MKRNIIITLVIILGIIVLMFIGDVITIGEKLARVTHLWWVEYAFYGVILLAFLWLVIRPIVKLHRTPELPSLNHEGMNNVVELKKFGARLAENCNYIADEKLRVDHQLQLRNDVQQWHDEQNLSLVVDREVQLRLHGDAALGVRGIDPLVRQWAQTVFMVTAVSPSSKIDTLSCLVLDYTMVKELILATGYRPTYPQLMRLYWRILITAVLSWCVSEALHGVGDIHPFSLFSGGVDGADVNVGEVADGTDVAVDGSDVVVDAGDIDPEAESGFSLGAILRNFKIPGIIAGPAIDGAVNALMTLRIGYVARTYLMEGAAAMHDSTARRNVKRQAVVDSMKNLPEVVINGSKGVGTGLTKFFITFFGSPVWEKYKAKGVED
ncbi:MAG: hypothetical protein J5543_00760 [Bacteroidales bacterium]|nr:hypothetical protein [Bacteroidales bacterium]